MILNVYECHVSICIPHLELQSPPISEDPEREFYRIHTQNSLVVGQDYSVYLEYQGPLKDDLKGIYWSSYQHDGATKYDLYLYLIIYILNLLDIYRRLCCNGPLWLQGEATSVYFFNHVIIVYHIQPSWPPYTDVCIVTTLTATSLGRLN